MKLLSTNNIRLNKLIFTKFQKTKIFTNFSNNFSTESKNSNDDITNLKNSIDSEQFKQLSDGMILVDEKDNKIGEISKLEGHLKSNNNKFPHRAFSVFLFNEKSELLLQQRSGEKITFPLMWTNSCCSHPLPITEEEPNIGVKKGAERRSNFELGIDIKFNQLLLVDIVLYKASLEKSIF